MPHRRRNKSKEDGTSGVSAGPDKKPLTAGNPADSGPTSQSSNKERAKKASPDADNSSLRPLAEEASAKSEDTHATITTPPSSLKESLSVKLTKAESVSLEDGLASLSTWSATEPWKDIGHFHVETSCLEELGATG